MVCNRLWRFTSDVRMLQTVLLILLLIIVILVYVLLFRDTAERGDGYDNKPRATQLPSGDAKASNTRAAGDAQPNPEPAPPTALTWSKYEISRTARFSIPYLNYRILIYEKEQTATANSTPEAGVYYYAPLLLISVSSTNLSFNHFEQRFTVEFSAIMYNQNFLDHIKQDLTKLTEKPVMKLRIMPIESIRVSIENPEWDADYEVDNSWRLYSNQADTVSFRVYCATGWKCQRLNDGLANGTLSLLSDAEVYYTLESQRSSARRITLTAEHIQTGKLFTELQQKFQGTDVYLSGEDAKQLQQEIASNVMAAEIADAEFVGGDQSPTLMHFIGEALKLQETTSASFTPKMWESVYWKEENARPDKITREYQDSFDKQDQETQHRIMDYFKKQESEKKCGNANFGIEGAGGVEVSACTNKGSSNSQRDEMEDYLRNINEGRKVTEMKGTRFIPKELALKRTNLAALKQTTNFGSLSIRISKIVGVMKTRFNYAGSSTDTAGATFSSDGSLTISKKQPSDIREAFHVRAARTVVTFTKAQASNICRGVFKCELATLAHMRDAWSHGADWCVVGHVAEEQTLAYPANTCMGGRADATYRADVCYKDTAEILSYVGVETGQWYNEAQSGLNCYGIRPLGREIKYYNGHELLVLPFNKSSFGQYQDTIK